MKRMQTMTMKIPVNMIKRKRAVAIDVRASFT